jgi:hypothetical protein
MGSGAVRVYQHLRILATAKSHPKSVTILIYFIVRVMVSDNFLPFGQGFCPRDLYDNPKS